MQLKRGFPFALLVVVLTGLASILPVGIATAQSGTPGAEEPALPQFGINPVEQYPHGYIELSLDPGGSKTVAARLVNSGSVDVSLIVHTANVTSAPNGGFAAGTDEEAPTGPTTWVDFQPITLDLPPGATEELSFTVTVPADIAPGQYITSLVAATSEPLAISGTTAFDQIIRSAAPIMVTVPGPVKPGFTIGNPELDAATEGTRLQIPIENTGNILVKPAGTLTLSTADGEQMVEAPIDMGSVYGGLSSMIQMVLPGQIPPGDYTITLDLKDEETGATASLDAVPVTLALVEEQPEATFVVDEASVTPNGEPIRFADVTATITNNGRPIPTANITLVVMRDGEEVERYPLAENQALPDGATEFSQRYIPLDDWQSGTWTFQLVIASVDGGTETILATIDVEDEIVVP